MSEGKLIAFLSAEIVLLSFPAHAYIGPGAGAGLIAVVLGVLASIVMAFFATLWYPAKRFIKQRKAARQKALSQKTGVTEGSER